MMTSSFIHQARRGRPCLAALLVRVRVPYRMDMLLAGTYEYPHISSSHIPMLPYSYGTGYKQSSRVHVRKNTIRRKRAGLCLDDEWDSNN